MNPLVSTPGTGAYETAEPSSAAQGSVAPAPGGRVETGAPPGAYLSLAPLARGPVFAVADGIGMLLLLTSGRYGYFGDELYFLAGGRRPD
jgi:hypothetical protein